jgi:gluconokinase
MQAMIIVVMGVSGAGKSTIGAKLAARLQSSFIDADDYHSPENIRKMSQGNPLTDADRESWLERLHQLLLNYAAQRQSVVLACSALKQKYRDLLSEGVPVIWVYLKGSEEQIRSHLAHRQGHFAGPALLRSQFAILEEPREAITVSIGSDPESAVSDILAQLSARNPS